MTRLSAWIVGGSEHVWWRANANGDDDDDDDPSRNEAWGFFGTMQTIGADPMQAWDAASAMIAAETEASPVAVRDFLDSRHGRHFADDVASLGVAGLEQAIEATIARWQGWRISCRTSRDEGVPAGLPYLTGWVAHFEILRETAD